MYASRAACFASCLLLPNRAKFDSWCCRPPKIRFALLFNFQDWCGTLPPWCRCNLMWLAVKNRSVLVSRISYGLITVWFTICNPKKMMEISYWLVTLRTKRREVFRHRIFSDFQTGFTLANRAEYPFTFHAFVQLYYKKETRENKNNSIQRIELFKFVRDGARTRDLRRDRPAR